MVFSTGNGVVKGVGVFSQQSVAPLRASAANQTGWFFKHFSWSFATILLSMECTEREREREGGREGGRESLFFLVFRSFLKLHPSRLLCIVTGAVKTRGNMSMERTIYQS